MRSSASARELLASSRRSCSFTPQAAPISSVGSSARRVALSPAAPPRTGCYRRAAAAAGGPGRVDAAPAAALAVPDDPLAHVASSRWPVSSPPGCSCSPHRHRRPPAGTQTAADQAVHRPSHSRPHWPPPAAAPGRAPPLGRRRPRRPAAHPGRRTDAGSRLTRSSPSRRPPNDTGPWNRRPPERPRSNRHTPTPKSTTAAHRVALL